ncbi:MAG: DUF6448 family protein [Methanoregula sp.]|jgi:hypothetical protein|nr:DUF6448 family protein [Methanoregula sp.]
MKRKPFSSLLAAIISCFVVSGSAYSHCDTIDGPVVLTAKKALDNGDVTPVLKWVKKEEEKDIREMFQKTLAVRSLSPQAKEMADMYFFETLVRIHRAGERQPYTGLKPAGELDPVIAKADKSIETGSVDELAKDISNEVAGGIRKKFELAMEKKKEADKNIDAGREFVEAYVIYLHYMEGIYNAAKLEGGHHPEVLPKESGKMDHHMHEKE